MDSTEGQKVEKHRGEEIGRSILLNELPTQQEFLKIDPSSIATIQESDGGPQQNGGWVGVQWSSSSDSCSTKDLPSPFPDKDLPPPL